MFNLYDNDVTDLLGENAGVYIPVILALIIIHLIFIIADLVKRGLLSRLAIWAGFMLTAPLQLAYCIYSISIVWAGRGMELLESVLTSEMHFTRVGRTLLVTLLSLITVIILAVLYIRGNIKPIHKKLPKYDGLDKDRLNFIASRRLLVTGIIGTLIYSPILIYMLKVVIEAYSQMGLPVDIITMLILLFVPIINIFIIIYLWVSGIIFAVVGFTAFLVYIELLLVTNACIRLTVMSDKNKWLKVLFSLLSFIPIFNIVYGIYSLKKASERSII